MKPGCGKAGKRSEKEKADKRVDMELTRINRHRSQQKADERKGVRDTGNRVRLGRSEPGIYRNHSNKK